MKDHSHNDKKVRGLLILQKYGLNEIGGAHDKWLVVTENKDISVGDAAELEKCGWYVEDEDGNWYAFV